MSDDFEDQFEQMQPSPQPNLQSGSQSGTQSGTQPGTQPGTQSTSQSTTSSGTQKPTLPASCVPEDFVSLAPTRCCVYLPCKSLWPNASIDDRFPPVPLLGPNGSPVLNRQGKVVMIPQSKELAMKRSVEKLVWAPGM